MDREEKKKYNALVPICCYVDADETNREKKRMKIADIS